MGRNSLICTEELWAGLTLKTRLQLALVFLYVEDDCYMCIKNQYNGDVNSTFHLHEVLKLIENLETSTFSEENLVK